jgi:hypothetical protein
MLILQSVVASSLFADHSPSDGNAQVGGETGQVVRLLTDPTAVAGRCLRFYIPPTTSLPPLALRREQ